MYGALVAKRNELRNTAVALGAIALVLIGIGMLITFTSDQGVSPPSAGIIIRSGAVLGALALILPSIRKPSLSTLLVVAAGLILVLARPNLIWAALAGWLAWILPRRQRRTVNKDS